MEHVFSRIRSEKIQVKENPYSDIFYAVNQRKHTEDGQKLFNPLTTNVPHKPLITIAFWINLFLTNNLLLYPLKTSENWRFSDVFRGYRN